VKTVAQNFRHTGIITENTAAEDVISMRDSEGKSMNLESEMMYQVTMSIARKMVAEGLVSKEEYRQIDTIFREKYQPKLGTLFVDLPYEQS